MVKISFCIPTYNFGAFIGDTLASIIQQADEDVEIVVLDGASQDNTAEVVAAIQTKFSRLHYYRQSVRGGIDHDMALSIEKASGDYCWLISADDILKPGSIAQFRQKLASKADVYVFGFTECTFHMQPIREYRITKTKNEMIFELSDIKQRRHYFSHAWTSPALFSFMSAVIVKRERWINTTIDQQFMGSLWALAARLFTMIPAGLKVHFIPDSYLSKRSGNDSFMDKGLAHRLGIAVYGYKKIADWFFGSDSFEAQQIRRILRNDLAFKSFLLAKGSISTHQELQNLNQVVQLHFIDGWHKIIYFVYRLFPVGFTKVLCKIHRQIKKVFGNKYFSAVLRIFGIFSVYLFGLVYAS